jgi:uncharacterized protein (TIGR03067 family)
MSKICRSEIWVKPSTVVAATFRVNDWRPALSKVQQKGLMKNSTNVLVLSLVLLAASGCSKRNNPGSSAKSDAVMLQKSWQGEEGARGASQANSLVLSGNNLEFHGSNPQEWYKGTFTLREDTTPKQMIVTITDCPVPKYIGKTANAIYRIENGTLTIAGNEPGNPAIPASFDAPGTRLITFKAQ